MKVTNHEELIVFGSPFGQSYFNAEVKSHVWQRNKACTFCGVNSEFMSLSFLDQYESKLFTFDLWGFLEK